MSSGFGSFEEWKAAMVHWCKTTYHIDPDEMPDQPYRDWYEDGVSYQEAARRTVYSGSKYSTTHNN